MTTRTTTTTAFTLPSSSLPSRDLEKQKRPLLENLVQSSQPEVQKFLLGPPTSATVHIESPPQPLRSPSARRPRFQPPWPLSPTDSLRCALREGALLPSHLPSPPAPRAHAERFLSLCTNRKCTSSAKDERSELRITNQRGPQVTEHTGTELTKKRRPARCCRPPGRGATEPTARPPARPRAHPPWSRSSPGSPGPSAPPAAKLSPGLAGLAGGGAREGPASRERGRPGPPRPARRPRRRHRRPPRRGPPGPGCGGGAPEGGSRAREALSRGRARRRPPRPPPGCARPPPARARPRLPPPPPARTCAPPPARPPPPVRAPAAVPTVRAPAGAARGGAAEGPLHPQRTPSQEIAQRRAAEPDAAGSPSGKTDRPSADSPGDAALLSRCR
ncbi:basic proline-rich protein-like [Canis lupus familiaris]|uniref:basic proline-rich protein-like n=1 Tax=Canis lupus familiaris TaxID=9615 RepID=UPI0018F43A8C|nr:basic proline-rich protein-like [Canis lupus familiaris]